jgi:hypothetical protein
MDDAVTNTAHFVAAQGQHYVHRALSGLDAARTTAGIARPSSELPS